jgi:hypothetical protein
MTNTTETTLQSRTRLLAVAVLLLTLIAGVGIGMAIGRPHGPRGFGPGRDGPRPEMGRERPGSPVRMFADRLKLSDAQQKQIDSIFAASRTQIGAFWNGPGAQLRQIIDSTELKVRAVLDSTQQAEFDKMHKQRERGRGRGPWDGAPGRGMGPGMPGPGGPPEGEPPQRQ